MTTLRNEKAEMIELYQNTGIRVQVVEEICELAQKYQVEKVVLFGSRARGDYKERSDIDLAFSGGEHANFILDVDELTSTLLQYDIVNLDGAVQKELLESERRNKKRMALVVKNRHYFIRKHYFNT